MSGLRWLVEAVMQKKWAIGGLGVVTAIVLFFALRSAKVDVKDAPPTPDAAPSGSESDVTPPTPAST